MDGNKYEYAPNVRAPSDQASWEEWEALKKKRDNLLKEADKTEAEVHAKWAKADE